MQTNERLALAERIAEHTGTSLFLTGKAGTGKTTFLRELRANSRKRIVVTAPTGIAAINAGGVTLHSFFQLEFGPFIPGAARREKFRISREKLKIIRGMDMLVIDEVSMVRADLLDAVDDALRRFRDRTKPFGGVQLLLIGDLQQLPPVTNSSEWNLIKDRYKSPYFFDSLALRQIDYETVELNEVFRQKDEAFLELLNAIRENRASQQTLDTLNKRCRPGFDPDDDEGYIRLTTHNNFANSINNRKLDQLPTPEHVFQAEVEGKFPESSFPADPELRLKVGAQVMFIKNDTESPRAYYNGMIGQVAAIDSEEGIYVRPADGSDLIQVQPAEWENVSYAINPMTQELEEKREGSFFQYPLRPAWAVTIHKSQGLTFNRAIIDASHSFAHGQTYVALSRCRSLEGLVLDAPLSLSAIINDRTINNYFATHNCEAISDSHLNELECRYRIQLLDELFSFRQLFAAMEGIVRLYQENFMRKMPVMVEQWRKTYEELRPKVMEVADKFRMQYSRLAREGAMSAEQLQQRVNAAAGYFLGQLKPLEALALNAVRTAENKKTRAKLQERLALFEDILTAKRLLLYSFKTRPFSTDLYLDLKAQAMLRSDGIQPPKRKREPREPKRIPAHVPAAAMKETASEEPVKTEEPKKAKKTKEPKKPKEPKVPSAQISADMARNGKSIEEIAEARGLATSTVTGHLMMELSPEEMGTIFVDKMDPAVRERIDNYLASHDELPSTLTDLRAGIGGELPYDTIRIMMICRNRHLSPFTVMEEPEATYGTPADFLD